METYRDITKVIERAIIPALGEYADDYDVEAIARETFAYTIDTDTEGHELRNTERFEQTISGEEFWEIVAKHTLSR